MKNYKDELVQSAQVSEVLSMKNEFLAQSDQIDNSDSEQNDNYLLDGEVEL